MKICVLYKLLLTETVGMHRVTKFEVLIMDIQSTFSALCHRKEKKHPNRKSLRKTKGKIAEKNSGFTLKQGKINVLSRPLFAIFVGYNLSMHA